MADVLKIDAHLHLYATKAIGAFEKGDYGIWEYGEKPGVKFSAYDGDLARHPGGDGGQRVFTRQSSSTCSRPGA